MIDYIARTRRRSGHMETISTSKPGYFVLVAISLICGLLASTSLSYAQSESVIYQFDCTNARQNGCVPDGGVIANNDALFGTTSAGGTSNMGTVFALTPPSTLGAPWSESVLYSFLGGTDGSGPVAGLLAGAGHILYGTTFGGGAFDEGTAFSLQPPSTPGASWIETVLYSFAGGSDARRPATPLIADSSGTLYGTTGLLGGGSSLCSGGCGTVYSLKPPVSPGGAWTESVIYPFADPTLGLGPSGGLVMDKSGTLYGTTFALGSDVVYSLTPPAVAGGAWTENVLYTFKDLLDGDAPRGSLVFDKSGRLFGVCQFGHGIYIKGTVFELTPPAISGGGWTEHTLWEFAAKPDGQSPLGVILGDDVLYGTTASGGSEDVGTVFQLTPPAALGSPWTETVLHAFSSASGTDGYDPSSGVVLGPGGALYGTTTSGAGSGSGTVYEVTP